MTGRSVVLDFIPNCSFCFLFYFYFFTDGGKTEISYPKEIPLDPTHFNMTQTWHSNLVNLCAEYPSISLFSKMGDLRVTESRIPVANLSPIHRGRNDVFLFFFFW